jgi:methyl coenzyme M reductase subunit C-like uncharacterized protein (methanogenesis marker protein 7)
MPPTLLAQAAGAAVDMATPFTLAVVILLVGLGVAYGASQTQIGALKEKLKDLEGRVTKREEHGGQVDRTLATVTTTLEKVDRNVEELLGRRRATAS